MRVRLPPGIGPIRSSEFDFPWTRTVVTAGVATDVGLDEEDVWIEDSNKDRVNGEGWGVEDIVVLGLLFEKESEKELKDVVRDDAGSEALSTKRKSRNNWSAAILPAYVIVNTCAALGRTGDEKNRCRYCQLSTFSGVNPTEAPPSRL